MTDTSLCPVCGRPNQCAVSAAAATEGQKPVACWCFDSSVVITDEVKALAAERKLPGAAYACICKECVQKLTEEISHSLPYSGNKTSL